jgi:transcription elongation factor Elf1
MMDLPIDFLLEYNEHIRKQQEAEGKKPLLPCPFCGEEAKVIGLEITDEKLYTVSCTTESFSVDEACMGFHVQDHNLDSFNAMFSTPEMAVAAWNRRAPTDLVVPTKTMLFCHGCNLAHEFEDMQLHDLCKACHKQLTNKVDGENDERE